MPKSTTSERWGAGNAFASVGTGKHRGAHRGNHDGGAWTAVLVRWRQLHDSLPSSHRRPVRRRDGLAPHGKAPGARWIDDRYRRTLSRGHGSQRPRHRRFSRGSAPMTRTTTKSWLLTLWIALPLAACAAPRRASLPASESWSHGEKSRGGRRLVQPRTPRARSLPCNFGG